MTEHASVRMPAWLTDEAPAGDTAAATTAGTASAGSGPPAPPAAARIAPVPAGGIPAASPPFDADTMAPMAPVRIAAAPAAPAIPFAPTVPTVPTGFDDAGLMIHARRPPRTGWRRAVHALSGGMINPGESPQDIERRALVDRINQPIRGDYRIAVLSLKGGVGKTTTTVGLGSTFASLRGDRVIAVDANPDLGTLAQRVPRQTASTVRDLLADPHLRRYSDVRAHTSQAPSRLEVLASERDPEVSEAFSEADYRATLDILQSFYNIILTDCGTGLMHSAMTGVLDLADALVLISSPAIDGARSAWATLDWLEAHGHRELAARTVVVLCASRSGAPAVRVPELTERFRSRCRAVLSLPYDNHLAEGADVDLELLSRSTRQAFMELAAVMADDFPRTIRLG